MAQRIIRRALTVGEMAEVREIIAAVQWKRSSSEEYELCPHSYVIKQAAPKQGITVEQWDRFAYLIKHCSVARQWTNPNTKHTQRYWYLILDGFCYWIMWPVLNRATIESLGITPLC